MNDLKELTKRMQALSGKTGKKRKPSQREPDTSLKKLNQRAARKRSKLKGSGNERSVSKLFTAWCGHVVRRTPQSGGWAGPAFGVSGDLVCASKHFPFHVECKKREDWQLDDLITGVRVKDERSIQEWWKQTVESCPKNKEPLLVFTRNRKAQLVMFHGSLEQFLNETVPHFRLYLPETLVNDNVIMPLDKFLAAYPVPDRMKEKRK